MSHWVQIELGANGSDTFGIQLDLDKITRVTLAREHKTLVSVKALYDSGSRCEELVLDKEAATSFMEKWVQKVKFEAIDEQAEPSIIFSGANKKFK